MPCRFAPYIHVEAVDRNGDVIGSSKVVKTIPPVEQDQAPTKPDVAGNSGDFPDGVPEILHPNTDDLLLTMTNAILFILGFACCVVMVGAWRMFHGLRTRPWWRRQEGVRYEAIPLESHERDESRSRHKVRWVDE